MCVFSLAYARLCFVNYMYVLLIDLNKLFSGIDGSWSFFLLVSNTHIKACKPDPNSTKHKHWLEFWLVICESLPPLTRIACRSAALLRNWHLENRTSPTSSSSSSSSSSCYHRVSARPAIMLCSVFLSATSSKCHLLVSLRAIKFIGNFRARHNQSKSFLNDRIVEQRIEGTTEQKKGKDEKGELAIHSSHFGHHPISH